MRKTDVEAEVTVAVARGHGLWDELDRPKEELPPQGDDYWKVFDRKLKVLAEIRQSLALLGRKGGGDGGPKSKRPGTTPEAGRMRLFMRIGGALWWKRGWCPGGCGGLLGRFGGRGLLAIESICSFP